MYANAQSASPLGIKLRQSVDGALTARNDMTQDQLQGICRQLSGTVKRQWGELTGNPRTVAAGVREVAAGKLQEQRGTVQQESRRQLEEFMSRNRDWRDLSRR